MIAQRATAERERYVHLHAKREADRAERALHANAEARKGVPNVSGFVPYPCSKMLVFPDSLTQEYMYLYCIWTRVITGTSQIIQSPGQSTTQTFGIPNAWLAHSRLCTRYVAPTGSLTSPIFQELGREAAQHAAAGDCTEKQEKPTNAGLFMSEG